MTNNNIWDCADMRPMISAKWSIDDSSVFYNFFFFFVRLSEFENFLLCERILINVTQQDETSS
jgi:hypothetical protein